MQIIKEEIDFFFLFLIKRRGLMMGFMTFESSSEVLPNPDIPYQIAFFFILDITITTTVSASQATTDERTLASAPAHHFI